MLKPFRPLRTTPPDVIMKVHSLYADAHNRNPSDTPSPEDALRELVRRNEDAEYFIGAYRHVDVAVMALYATYERQATIEALAVDARLRRSKLHLGSLALQDLESIAHADGIRRISLTSLRQTVPFYEKNGYRIDQSFALFVDMSKKLG
jgi:GNAT superfamily N-acetyltransferase